MMRRRIKLIVCFKKRKIAGSQRLILILCVSSAVKGKCIMPQWVILSGAEVIMNCVHNKVTLARNKSNVYSVCASRRANSSVSVSVQSNSRLLNIKHVHASSAYLSYILLWFILYTGFLALDLVPMIPLRLIHATQ
jgi:hypothetical protein